MAASCPLLFIFFLLFFSFFSLLTSLSFLYSSSYHYSFFFLTFFLFSSNRNAMQCSLSLLASLILSPIFSSFLLFSPLLIPLTYSTLFSFSSFSPSLPFPSLSFVFSLYSSNRCFIGLQ